MLCWLIMMSAIFAERLSGLVWLVDRFTTKTLSAGGGGGTRPSSILTRIIFCFSPQVTRNHYPCRGSPFLHRHPSLPSPFATPQTRSEQTYFSGASREISFSNIICFYRPRVATDGLEVTLSKPKPSENRNPKGPLLTNNLKKWYIRASKERCLE